MTEKTIKNILKILSRESSRRWDNEEMKQKIQTWSNVLRDITDEQGKKGLRKALENPGEFMVSVGKFRVMCLSAHGSMNFEDDGSKAWDLVIKNLDSSMAPVFADTSIAETVNKLGGWVPFCLSINEKNKDFKRREFIGLYVMCRNMNQEFSPLPDRVNKFFHDGKNRPDYQFIGFDNPAKQKQALQRAILQMKNSVAIAGLLAGKNEDQQRIGVREYLKTRGL